jgi:hypothetical protein
MTYSEDPGSFGGVSINGVACSGGLSDVWTCSVGFDLDGALGPDRLEVTVASIPEPSTWALTATGLREVTS